MSNNVTGNTFIRATLGFTALACAITALAYTGLWAIDKFADGVWWGGLIVVLLGMVAVIATYMDTLSEPVRDWIKETKRAREEAEHIAREAARANKGR
jgi:hypothetical protein